MPQWTDLLDPSPEELRRHLPKDIHPRALEQLLADAKHDDEPRPKLEGHGNYIFGVFLVPVLVPNEDRIYYQEVDLIGTREGLLTVRKTPERGEPYDISPAQASCRVDEGVGMNAYHLMDDIAERYLDLIDGLNDEIDGSRVLLSKAQSPRDADDPFGTFHEWSSAADRKAYGKL